MKKKRFYIGVPIVIIAIGLLFFNAVRSGSYFYTVSELYSMGEAAYEQSIRVEGLVKDGSIQWTAQTRETRFVLEDEENPSITLRVVYVGVVPDTFVPGVQLVAEGKFNRDGTFAATAITPKCASKYEPELS
ncbi:MAG: cytochrome c maturation protein CcmE [Chloroflexi bacterium]|nr:cytochrome c maturation protein CcmE [Chloroflexota bacterium]